MHTRWIGNDAGVLSEAASLERPLSTAQRAFWDKQTDVSDGAGIIIGLSIDIFAPVEPTLFQAAVQALVDQSEAFRTSFARVDGTIVQIIHRDVRALVRALDLSGPGETDESRARAVDAWSHVPFDLGVAPLTDNLLVRVGSAHWTWHCRAHHLVLDGAGGGIGVAAILQSYAALAAGGTPDLSHLGSYLEYLDGDDAYIASDRYQRDLAYWMARHATPAPRLFEPGEGAPEAVRPLQRMVERPQYDALADACRAENVQPFHAFVATLGALAFRLFGRTSLSLGLATHNRTSELDRRTVGLFAGTMAFRLGLDPNESLAELARRASLQLRRDYRHARLPLSQLAAAVSSGDTPLFDIALSFQPVSYETEVNGARVHLRTAIFAGIDTEPAAIHVRAPQGDSPLGVDLMHRPDLVRGRDVVDLYESFVHLLGRWADVRTEPIARLSLEM